MTDNGLLEYYKNCSNKDGFLELDKMPLKKSHNSKYYTQTPDGKGFYVKKCGYGEVDAEVLVSQIYAQLGLATAIYLPAIVGDRTAVISNDISGKNSLRMFDYLLDNVNAHLPQRAQFGVYDISRFYLPQAIRTLGLVESANLASGNIDFHIGNYFVKVNKQSDFVFDKLPIEDIFPFDYGMCYHSFFGDEYARNVYYTTLTQNSIGNKMLLKTKPQAINLLKENPLIQSNISSYEIAEKLGNVDVYGIAEDIAQTTGYEISPSLLKAEANSFYEVAEQFAK